MTFAPRLLNLNAQSDGALPTWRSMSLLERHHDARATTLTITSAVGLPVGSGLQMLWCPEPADASTMQAVIGVCGCPCASGRHQGRNEWQNREFRGALSSSLPGGVDPEPTRFSRPGADRSRPL